MGNSETSRILSGARGFLEQLRLDRNVNLEIEQVFFHSTQGQLSVDDVLAAVDRTPTDLIGISLHGFGALPLCVALMREADRLDASELKSRVDYLAAIVAAMEPTKRRLH